MASTGKRAAFTDGPEITDWTWPEPSSKRPKRQRTQSTTVKTLLKTQKATVKRLANDFDTVAAAANFGAKVDKETNHDTAVLARIKKALNLANHGATGENETKAALRMARKLMQKHNINEVEAMEQEDEEDTGSSGSRKSRAGHSIVSIATSEKKQNRSVKFQTFVGTIASAMCTFFVCKSFSTQYRDKIEWTFYGIAENTVAAALAFEMVHNLVQEWAQQKKGVTHRNSYCLGVADGLSRTARDEQKKEEKQAKEAGQKLLQEQVREEQEAREQELKRLEHPDHLAKGCDNIEKESRDDLTPPISRSASSELSDLSDNENAGEEFGFYESDDDRNEDHADFVEEEEEDVDAEANFSDELSKYIKPDPDGPAAARPIKPDPDAASRRPSNELSSIPNDRHAVKIEDIKVKLEEVEDEDDPPVAWKSETQLIRFNEHAKTIAETYLKENWGFKLKKGKKRGTGAKLDHRAYTDGKKDSKKINVRQRNIEGPMEAKEAAI